MSANQYAKNIVTETREYTPEEVQLQKEMMEKNPVQSTGEGGMRLLWMDENMVKGASFYMECLWLWRGETTSGTTEEPHLHEDFDEVIGFISTDRDNPEELDAKMEIILGDETHFLTKSCLVYIPAGMKHCPLTFRKVNRPTFFFTLAPKSTYGRLSETVQSKVTRKANFVPPEPDENGSRYARYIITGTHGSSYPAVEDKGGMDFTRVVSLDDKITKGVMQADFGWIWEGSGSVFPQPQTLPKDELIGVINYDRQNPRELNAGVELAIGDEKQALTKSSLVFVPKGLNRYPLTFTDVKKPTMYFSIRNTPGKSFDW